VKKRYICMVLLLVIIIVIGVIGIKIITRVDLSKNLILYYSFDDLKEASIIDDSGNENNGTKEGTANIDSIGKINGSLSLDGQGSVKLPNNILNGLNELTVSAWVQYNVANGSEWQRIYDFGNDTNNNLFLSKNRTNNFNSNRNVEGLNGGNPFTDDKWYFITTTITKDTMIYYENGVEVNRKEHLKNKLSSLKDSIQNYIGKSKYSADPNFNGYIDEFRIYNKALTAKEISELMYYKISDKETVAMVSERIDLKDTEEVSDNISLPIKLGGDIKVSWASSNKSIISNEGKVTLPLGNDDVEVTLTAEIKKGKASLKKEFLISVLPKGAENYSININTSKPKFDISKTLFGLFFEDINHGADGGLYSELVQNDSFEYDDKLESWTLYKKGQASEVNLEVNNDQPLNDKNTNYARLKVTNAGDGVGIINSGYKGIAVKKNAKYDFSLWGRNLNSQKVNLNVQLESADGKVISDIKTMEGFNTKWTNYETELVATSDDKDARLVVYTKDAGTIDLDMVTLFPKDTWKDVKHGLRKDLVQMIYDIKPKFIRFPGGCIVQGKEKEDMYQWKDTIGKVEERKVNKNFWGYYQSYGLGFYEYFQLCEDIGAEPLPVINAGMSWQTGGEDAVSNYMAEPGEELNKYIQDALDLIEYANGDATTTWGKKRAESGHPTPFNLKYLAVGNEQWGDVYFKRFEEFQKAINKKYPKVQLIVNSGTAASGNVFDEAWNWTKTNNFSGLVDEHYYMPTDWFLNNTNRYDNYDRKGAKVFVGEYAAQDINKKNNLETALAEAAYMTGLERNSDIVKMASYAPLFAKENDSQWTPDMIWFNGTEAYGTPNYYVQKLFSTNTGNKLLDSVVVQRNTKASGLYSVSSLDEATGEVIIKVVNATNSSKKVKFDLAGVSKDKLSGTEIKLSTSNIKDENSFTSKEKVAPVTKKINGMSSKFDYSFDAQSLTIIRLKINMN
jgi:alpha-L-arabinofuranosidase